MVPKWGMAGHWAGLVAEETASWEAMGAGPAGRVELGGSSPEQADRMTARSPVSSVIVRGEHHRGCPATVVFVAFLVGPAGLSPNSTSILPN